MMNAEQVVIDVIANDKATSILENVRGKLIEINMRASEYASKISSLNQPVQTKIPQTPITPKVDASQSSLDDFNNFQTSLDDFGKKGSDIPIQSKLEDFNNTINTTKQNVNNTSQTVNSFGEKLADTGKKGSDAGKKINDGFKVGRSVFNEMNTLLLSLGGQFQNLSSQIAGLFGVASFSELIEKMWQGAAERQTNMLYLIHQKGVQQANEYYDEIMSIVTQLPGDDTFLTNILNMASAMDDNIKLDNLKELGQAITDYYISATMKGELPFETQKDLRKYLTTGETKPLRNSLLANEIEMLENKNSVLERGQALQKALEKNGLAGMSQYESATNELEEFKGHFQKAFADIGTLVISITQPLLKLYNALDTVFGSRLSQIIIIIGTLFAGFFAILGGGIVLLPMLLRPIELLGQQLAIMGAVLRYTANGQGLLNGLLIGALGPTNAEAIAINGSVSAGLKKIAVDIKRAVATELNIAVTERETISLWGLTTALFGKIKTTILDIATSIKHILFGTEEVQVTLAEEIATLGYRNALYDATLMENINTVAKEQNIRVSILKRIESVKDIAIKTKEIIVENLGTKAGLMNTMSKLKDIAVTITQVGIIMVKTVYTMISEGATYSEALAHAIDTTAKIADTEATLGLATATALLEAELAPLIVPILVIIGAFLVLITVVEKVGEAFGWWSDFGSMFDAISDGVQRLWDAFANSEIIQGIIQYFGDFVATIQDVFKSIYDMFAKIFGWEDDGGTFDIVHTLVSVFGKLGEVVKWVWNMLDDWSNSPFGLITWISPLGILLFHLDELGSFLEDIRDAIDRFTGTDEFNTLVEEFNEALAELQEPFQEIWSIVEEIMDIFGEVFQDPVGQGTEDRINVLVEVLKGLALIIRITVIPAIRGLALVIRVILTPIKLIATLIREIGKVVQWVTGAMDGFGGSLSGIANPLNVVYGVLDGIKYIIESITNGIRQFISDVSSLESVKSFLDKIYPVLEKIYNWFVWYIDECVKSVQRIISAFQYMWNAITKPFDAVKKIFEKVVSLITAIGNAIRNSFIGKLLGWDKEDKTKKIPTQNANTRIYDKIKDSNGWNSGNVNSVRNLGKSYNSTNNQKQVIINQNFSEGSMPIDARNMTKEEARKMFIGAFGYNRSVGSRGILR